MDDFWIFGYGSLMWHPGFSYQDLQHARLFGYHRRLCIYSYYYRGTPEHPGLVMGLNPGGSCRGMAFHIPKNEARKTYDYLIEREQRNSAYKEKNLHLHLGDGRKVCSLVFVADCAHPQYAGALSLADTTKIVSAAKGQTGSNQDYVFNTVRYLRTVHVHDPLLEKIAKQLSR